MESFCIRGNIVTEDAILPNFYLQIENSKIVYLSNTEPPGNIPCRDYESAYILSGFRDPHIHDIKGQLNAPSLSIDQIANRFQTVMHALAKRGVTGVYMATFGGAIEDLEQYCRGAYEWMINNDNGKTGTKLLGINIEGTFLNDECRGAQPAEYCMIPTRDDCIAALDRLHATGAVKMVNIVPDYDQPSLDTIKHAHGLGMSVGSGHTKCPADVLRDAFENYGLRYMVHLTNGPTGQSFKPFGGGGTFEGSLHIPIVKELVLDRFHVDERYILDIIKRSDELWGPEKVIAVTDSSFPISEEVPKEEFLIGTTVAKKDESGLFCRSLAYMQPDGSRIPAPYNTLCGSILAMDKAFGNVVTILVNPIRGHWFDHLGMPIQEAILKASQLCSANQAKLDGTFGHTGSITIGKDADLVVGTFNKKEGEYDFAVQSTFVGGHEIL